VKTFKNKENNDRIEKYIRKLVCDRVKGAENAE